MNTSVSSTVSLTSTWFIRPGCEKAADVALRELAAAVEREEPDTMTYLVNRPIRGNPELQSLPPVDPLSVLFFETYRNAAAFEKHVNGPVFTSFVKKYGELFVQSNGSPFTFVNFLETHAGFVRTTDVTTAHDPHDDNVNHHPGVMFEVIARDQASLKQFYTNVFSWHYDTGTSGFAYVPFPVETLPLLGGIGQAAAKVPGFEPGTNFYLRVEDLEAAIERALRNGGSLFVEPTEVDGYTFAMVKDPEGNAVGLIKPF
jgi:uncharacterized protein